MADPLIAPPKRTSNATAWVAKGVATDPETAKRRIAASRKMRRKPVAKTTLSTTCNLSLAKAIEAISDRYDESRSKVVKQMLEDGVRKYGNTAEKELAGLTASPEANPFKGLVPASVPAYPATPLAPFANAAPVFPPIGMTAGLPLTQHAPNITAEIEDDTIG